MVHRLLPSVSETERDLPPTTMTACCLFLLLLLLCHGCGVVGGQEPEDLGAPSLKRATGVEEVVVPAGANLTLVCEGDSVLYWYHEVREGEVSVDTGPINCSTVSIYNGPINCSTVSVDTGPVNCSTVPVYTGPVNCLTVSIYNGPVNCLNVSVDTGPINCSTVSIYNGPVNCSTVPVNTGPVNCTTVPASWVRSGPHASLYLTVHDGGPEESATLTGGGAPLIRLRALPNITLCLYKDGVQMTDPPPFDPRKGLELTNVETENSGHYECIASQQHEGAATVTLSSTRGVDGGGPGGCEDKTPTLKQNKNQYFVRGYNITLKCIVRTSNSIEFDWSVPPSACERLRVTNDSDKIDQISTLEVVNASLADSGNYTCYVKNCPASQVVTVQEHLEPFINLTDGKSILNTNESKGVLGSASLHVFPPDPIIVLKNWNGSEVQQTDRVTFNQEMAEVFYVFPSPSADDYGDYSLQVTTRDGAVKQSLHFLLSVLSKPRLVSEGNTSRRVRAESVIEEQCDVQGFPLPDVNWTFQPCQLGLNNCLQEAYDPESLGADVERHTSGAGNILSSTLSSFKPNVSGILSCSGHNIHGNAVSTFVLHLSDMDEEFVFCREQGNRCASILNKATIEVKEGESLMVRCAGSKFVYQNVSLSGPPHRNSIIEISQFSFVREARIESVSGEDKSTYTCTATRRIGDQHENSTVKLIVLPGSSLNLPGQLIISFTCGGIVILVIVVLRLSKRVKEEKQFRKAFRQNELYLFRKGNICQLNRDCTADEQAELLPYDQKWEVAHEDIQICKQLGSGAFGRVVAALVKGLEGPKSETLVAIKMCKNQADPSQVRALAIELKIMIHIGQHLNIVNLMGANTRNIGRGELWILLEYCHHGNLLSFMHHHRQCFINQVDPITDNIDPMMLVPDADGIVSPSTSYRRNSSQASRSERTLSVPVASPSAKLTSTPGSRADEPFASSTTDCSLSPATTIIQPRQQVQNPLYNFFNRLSHKASEDNKMMSVPHEASEDNKMVSIPPHEASEDNKMVSVPPHEASEDYKMVSIPPHEAADDNKMVSVPPHEASEDNKIASVPPRKASEDTCCGRPPTELEKGTENMQAVSSATSDQHGMNTDSTAFSSSQMYSSEQPSASPEGSNGYVPHLFGCDIGKVPGVSAPFATSDLVNWAWQVAQGMNYLTSRKVLHGDLAARNLLLADHNIVKISDFGLSRDMYKKDIYMKQGDDLMPIKWLSVEAIRDHSFSVQSDVWAFGITMWELFTLGSIPYPGIEVNKDFLQLLESGHRMAKPKYANHKIYDLMLKCWALEPRNRPSFFDASSVLGELMHSNLRTEYAALNDPYQLMNEERFKVETDFLSMLASPDIDHIRQGHSPNTHYVNIQRAGEGPQGGSDTAHRPPAGLEYSPEGPGTPSPHSQPPSSEYGGNYLPMSASFIFTNSNNIFSPRSNTEPRFTFDEDELEASSAKNGVLIV